LVDPAFDAEGNMYVTTTEGGVHGDGNVVQLTRSGGQWTPRSIHDFNGTDGYSPYSGVAIDAQGNLYPTAYYGGPNGAGSVYLMTRPVQGGRFKSSMPFRATRMALCLLED